MRKPPSFRRFDIEFGALKFPAKGTIAFEANFHKSIEKSENIVVQAEIIFSDSQGKNIGIDGSGVHTRNGDTIELKFRLLQRFYSCEANFWHAFYLHVNAGGGSYCHTARAYLSLYKSMGGFRL